MGGDRGGLSPQSFDLGLSVPPNMQKSGPEKICPPKLCTDFRLCSYIDFTSRTIFSVTPFSLQLQ